MKIDKIETGEALPAGRSAISSLPVQSISIRTDARAISEATLSGLENSIVTVGLINPIRVRALSPNLWEVIAGAHRLTACRRLGLVEIDCLIVQDDDLHAELAMIDENLCRAELSPSDRARQTARRKAIYLELHPDTAQHVAGGKARQDRATDKLSFADATAAVTGADARTVRRDAERGEKVIDEALDLIRGTKLDTGTYLDKLKAVPGSEQFAVAQRDLSTDKEARAAEQAQHDQQRADMQSALGPDIKDAQAKKAEAIAARQGGSDADTAQLEAEIDELRETNTALEGDLAEARRQVAQYDDMAVQFEQGGFDKVIAGKDEEIRVLETRLYSTNADMASWMKKSKWEAKEKHRYKAEAEKRGYSDDIDMDDIDPATGEVING